MQQNEEYLKIEALLKRVELFLEDGDWNKAEAYCERILDTDPENPRAYIGLMLALLHINREIDLADTKIAYAHHEDYIKALRFASDEYAQRLQGYVHTNLYTKAKQVMDAANTEDEFNQAADLFSKISDYLDAGFLASQCTEKAKAIQLEREEKARQIEEAQKQSIYHYATRESHYIAAEDIKKSIQNLSTILDYKDSRAKVAAYKTRLAKIEAEAEAQLRKRTWGILATVVLSVLIIVLSGSYVINKKEKETLKNVSANLNGVSFSTTYGQPNKSNKEKESYTFGNNQQVKHIVRYSLETDGPAYGLLRQKEHAYNVLDVYTYEVLGVDGHLLIAINDQKYHVFSDDNDMPTTLRRVMDDRRFKIKDDR